MSLINTLDIKVKKVQKSRLAATDFSNIQFGKVYSDHMFVADYVDGQWSKCSIEPYENLEIPPANFTLHYGQSVFEGLKGYKGDNGKIHVFRPYDNLKRMNISASRLCMPKIPEEIFIDGLKALIEVDKGWVPEEEGTALYIRPIMFGNDEYIGIKPSDNYKFIIFTCPVGPYYSEALKVKIELNYVRAAVGGTGYAKVAGNYAASLLPAQEAMKEGYQQLIWTDGKDHERIEESGTMNLMFIINDAIVTPQTGETILRGITRDSILTIARDWGIKVEERDVTVTEVIDGIRKGYVTEAFGTGTAATITYIKAIGYKGIDYNLPPVPSESISRKILDHLLKLHRARTEDKYNWLLDI